MQPDHNFEFKPGNDEIEFNLNINGKEKLFETTLYMYQAKSLRDALDAAIQKAEEIHAIIESAGKDVKTLKVTI